MPLEIASLSELSQTKIDQMFATLSQLMQERHPEVELTRGVFHDLVLYFNSVLNAAIKENIERVQQSNSLLKIIENPALAEPELVDNVLSNYNLIRQGGTAATGEATVILLQNVVTNIPRSLRLSADGTYFNPAAIYTLVPYGSPVTNTYERQIIPVGDGTFAANINVVAEVAGTAGNIKRGTTLVPDFSTDNTVKIYAANDFVTGSAEPTNAEYVEKLPAGLAAKTIGGRTSYSALIKNQPEFQNVRHISVIGFGDPEQQRDQHSLFPISGGGRVDVYVQSYDSYQTKDHLLQATYIAESTTDIGTIWQIEIDKNIAPGFYEIARIAKPSDTGATGYPIQMELRGMNYENEDFIPDVLTKEEGAYTRYQTAVIRFLDPTTTAAGLTPLASKAYYKITTTAMPLIGAIQDFVSSRDIRSRTADVLIRAAVPCFTKISFTIRKDAASAIPDLTAIKKAVVGVVSKIGFSGQLHASAISTAVHGFLIGKQALGPIDMFGRILRPDGQNTFIRDNTILQIPNDPGRLITGKTTTFLLDPADISISVDLAGFTN